MASLAAIFRQVAREGARWGLVPVLHADCVKVCEMVWELPPRPKGTAVIPRQVPRVVCSLDETSGLDGFSSVLLHRLKREHHDFMKMVRTRQNRLRAEAQAELSLRQADLRRKLAAMQSGRMIFTGIMR